MVLHSNSVPQKYTKFKRNPEEKKLFNATDNNSRQDKYFRELYPIVVLSSLLKSSHSEIEKTAELLNRNSSRISQWENKKHITKSFLGLVSALVSSVR